MPKRRPIKPKEAFPGETAYKKYRQEHPLSKVEIERAKKLAEREKLIKKEQKSRQKRAIKRNLKKN